MKYYTIFLIIAIITSITLLIISIIFGQYFTFLPFICIIPLSCNTIRRSRANYNDQHNENLNSHVDLSEEFNQIYDQKSNQIVCLMCGNKISEENLRFCPHCGNKLKT